MANIMKFKYICGMISFTCDYNEGAHPAILERLSKTNFIQATGRILSPKMPKGLSVRQSAMKKRLFSSL